MGETPDTPEETPLLNVDEIVKLYTKVTWPPITMSVLRELSDRDFGDGVTTEKIYKQIW